VTLIYFQGEAYTDENFLNSTPNKNTVIIKAPLHPGVKWDVDSGMREIVDLNATADTRRAVSRGLSED
jgi:hypothetical protein